MIFFLATVLDVSYTEGFPVEIDEGTNVINFKVKYGVILFFDIQTCTVTFETGKKKVTYTNGAIPQRSFSFGQQTGKITIEKPQSVGEVLIFVRATSGRPQVALTTGTELAYECRTSDNIIIGMGPSTWMSTVRIGLSGGCRSGYITSGMQETTSLSSSSSFQANNWFMVYPIGKFGKDKPKFSLTIDSKPPIPGISGIVHYTHADQLSEVLRDDPNEDNPLSTGIIVGIVVAAIVIVSVTVIVVITLRHRKKKQQITDSDKPPKINDSFDPAKAEPAYCPEQYQQPAVYQTYDYQPQQIAPPPPPPPPYSYGPNPFHNPY